MFEFTLLFGMLRRVPLNLRRSLRNLHTHASYYKRSGFTVETVLATAVVAGSILWYSTNTRIHNDALPFSEKQQKLSSPSLAKLAEHGALTTVVWGSNRQAYSSRYSDYFFLIRRICQVRRGVPREPITRNLWSNRSAVA